MNGPTTARAFARLRPDPGDASGVWDVPADGMCLSAFLLVSPPDDPGATLLGQIDLAQPWGELGGLNPDRLAALRDRWMIPSSHLLLQEDPLAAARRIASEQLGVPELPITGPLVRSESYGRGAEAASLHWDLHFIYRAVWPVGRPLRAAPFAALRFFPSGQTPEGGIARGGGDILALAQG